MKTSTYKFVFMYHPGGRWPGMPLEREIEATDLSTALVIAWERERQKGIYIRSFSILNGSK